MGDWIDEAVVRIKKEDAEAKASADAAKVREQIVAGTWEQFWRKLAETVQENVTRFNGHFRDNTSRQLSVEHLAPNNLSIKNSRGESSSVLVSERGVEIKKVLRKSSGDPHRQGSFNSWAIEGIYVRGMTKPGTVEIIKADGIAREVLEDLVR